MNSTMWRRALSLIIRAWALGAFASGLNLDHQLHAVSDEKRRFRRSLSRCRTHDLHAGSNCQRLLTLIDSRGTPTTTSLPRTPKGRWALLRCVSTKRQSGEPMPTLANTLIQQMIRCSYSAQELGQ